MHVLVVFAHFQDEAPQTVPDYALRLFDPDLPGSFAHFYRTMSFGQLQVRGTVLPRRYTSARPTAAYQATAPGEFGQYGAFAREILAQVDADIDLAQFDDDGPDGLPNSGDDDGQVDYVFLILQSVPRNFLRGGATGIVGLGYEEDYFAADTSLSGDPIRISGDIPRGAMAQEGSFSQTVGTLAHEFGHSLELPDLYDLDYDDPAHDSAGIGKWGLMGWGAHGWHGDDGPNPLCAWGLEQLGWIGPANERLVDVEEDMKGLHLRDLFARGNVYRIPLRTHGKIGRPYNQEYLLLEYRARDGHYYNRHLPAEGLLVWHIRPRARNNNQEENKLVDLVCADGLYEDAGYPRGEIGAPYVGRDNLDFWAHDAAYTAAHAGNLGDATDLFDGIRFTRFDAGTNPSADIGQFLPEGSTSLTFQCLENRELDIELPRWSGILRGEIHWLGSIVVDGDLTIAPEGTLVITGNTRVRFTGRDRLRSGLDPDRCELHVQGELRVQEGPVYCYTSSYGNRSLVEEKPSTGSVLEALVPGETWYGILPASSTRLQKSAESLVIRDATHDFRASEPLPTVLEEIHSTETSSSSPIQSRQLSLSPGYPNPFNAATTLRYTLFGESPVRLVVHDALGRTVRTLVDKVQPSGSHRVIWDGRDDRGNRLASGVYLYRLQAGNEGETRQLVLVK